MEPKKRIIIKLSGEALSNGNNQAIDSKKVRMIAKEVKAAYDLGNL